MYMQNMHWTSGIGFIPSRMAHIIGNYHEIIEHHRSQAINDATKDT